MIEQKSISTIDKFLGQYMTPSNITKEIVNDISSSFVDDSLYIEPSFGTGNFIKSLLDSGVKPEDILGIELDTELFNSSGLSIKELYNINFYDFNETINRYIHFIGNVPFRTPALSLRSHREEIKRLTKKYNVRGIREEAVFFILKSLEVIEISGMGGRISYIIPKNLLTTNSKFFKTFHRLLEDKFEIISITDLPKNIFDGAVLDTCVLDMRYDISSNKKKVIKNNTEYWTFNDIFKRTYLGSVPCESIFLSAPNESIEEFKDRLVRLFVQYPSNVNDNLRKNGVAHLKVLNGSNTTLLNEKIKVICEYIQEIYDVLGKNNILNLLNDINNYKPIHHRHEVRYYFRNTELRKCSFVYEINPNPQKSFYFTGNPSSSSTDYFGFCEYDITRNSSPGACRTIPVYNLSGNITNEFSKWWDDTYPEKSYDYLFDIFLKVHKSTWYKNMKKKHKRFYFGIPKDIIELNHIMM